VIASNEQDTEKMTSQADEKFELKRRAAERAVQFVESGMTMGLGTGTTAILAVRMIGERIKTGTLSDISAVATSKSIATEAEVLGIPLIDESIDREIDLTIDGADQVDQHLVLIKGHGGALLREKIVAQSSRRVMIIVDESKLTTVLGAGCAVPVEVTAFGLESVDRYITSLGARVELRRTATGDPFVTDSGNRILDCSFGPIENPGDLATELKKRAGIVEHGLFLGIATDVIVASRDGVRHLTRG
jgi:ribose 5-phosphate isomerase A